MVAAKLVCASMHVSTQYNRMEIELDCVRPTIWIITKNLPTMNYPGNKFQECFEGYASHAKEANAKKLWHSIPS